MGILVAAELAIQSITNILKGYTPGQLIFGHDTIIPIRKIADRELILQWKKAKINKYNNCENVKILDWD